MARTVAAIHGGVRLTDCIALGAITKFFPREAIAQALADHRVASLRERLLPAHVVVYYIIGMWLFMHVSTREVFRTMVEGFAWLGVLPIDAAVPGKAAISRARSRIGAEPLRQLHDQIIQPIAIRQTKGAWLKDWRLVSIDGSTLELPDEAVNEAVFGRPPASHGTRAFPAMRFVSLVENGTHVLFGSQFDAFGVSEQAIATRVMTSLKPGMLCLADRGFASYALFKLAAGTGADLIWRTKHNAMLPVHRRLPDGSYLSAIHPGHRARTADRDGITVRVIEYRLDVPGADPIYRLITTILDSDRAAACDLAAAYHDRWEIETAFDELKTHLRGNRIVMRSKTPELVRQEFYGLMLAHFAIRGLMHEAALAAGFDPDRLSYVHAIRVIRRRLPAYHASPPSGEESAASEDTL